MSQKNIAENSLGQQKLTVNVIPAFSDNYIWALGNHSTDNVVLVDPGDAQVCIDYIEAEHKVLTEILITHHHQDHVGGLPALKSYCQEKNWPLTIYTPEHESIAYSDVAVNEQSQISLASLACSFEVIELPGHTLGHIAYISQGHLFCGDTLFSGGCGRVFEGTYQQMHHSLNKLSALEDDTKIYCAHEYTQANVNFALAVEPNNIDLVQYYNQVKKLREQQLPTLPSTIALERSINPFLRCQQSEVIQSAELYSGKTLLDSNEVFATIRQWKDIF